MISTVTKIGRRSQITLPRSIRRQLGLKENDRVAFVRSGNRIFLQPLTQTLFDLRGSVPVTAAQDFTAIRREAIRTHAREVACDES